MIVKTCKIILLTFLMFLSFFGYAADTANVLNTGCHINTNMCYARLDISIQNNCATTNDNSARWDGSTVNGHAVLSILLTAQAQNKTVTFHKLDTICYAGYPSFIAVEVDD